MPPHQPAKTERPVEDAAIARPSPARLSEVREEIQGRVAAFRAHQELFHRERDKYYNSVLAKVRGTTERPFKAADDQLTKR